MSIVSVIIPVHNCAEFLPRCVESVFAQTYDAVELVMVDDGSSDSSPELLKAYATRTDEQTRVTIVTHEKSKGVSAARNSAVAAATGDYLFFIDGDDWIEPETLALMVARAKEMDLEVCCGTHEYYHSEDDRSTDLDTGGEERQYESNEALLEAYCNKQISTFTWNKLLKRSLFGEGGLYFEESLLNDEDQLWSFRLLMRVQRWLTLPAVTYHYYKDNPTSITAESFTMRRLRNYYSVLGYMNDEVKTGVDWTTERARLLALGMFNHTKSILWHIEFERDVNYRELYAEFKRKNVLGVKSAAYTRLEGKNRMLAWGWGLPYPLSRFASPYFLHKVKSRLGG